jgi:hypothetical protein
LGSELTLLVPPPNSSPVTLDGLYEPQSTRGGCAVVGTFILVIVLLALVGLGGWFVIRALGSRRR